ncbi:MAG: ribose 5-phosphate isomerase B [Acidobacteriota bacterium]|nr:ribose 5-phosphate isomerase B [Thermoanaerobaculaceae bacterium]
MRIAIASDHAGYELKKFIKDYLQKSGRAVEDFGTDSEESVDYPDFAKKVCEAVLSKGFERGILVCGSGVGMSISANRFKGIRAVLCQDLYTAEYSRLHNNSNVLCLPGRLIGKGLAEKILEVWLKTKFEGGRHLKRIEKIEEIAKETK